MGTKYATVVRDSDHYGVQLIKAECAARQVMQHPMEPVPDGNGRNSSYTVLATAGALSSQQMPADFRRGISLDRRVAGTRRSCHIRKQVCAGAWEADVQETGKLASWFCLLSCLFLLSLFVLLQCYMDIRPGNKGKVHNKQCHCPGTCVLMSNPAPSLHVWHFAAQD